MAAVDWDPCKWNWQVSIPSQAGILLAGDSWLPRPGRSQGLNTLTGGHPLGGSKDASWMASNIVSIPSQAGILLAVLCPIQTVVSLTTSQYPHRRASSWRMGIWYTASDCSRSQYPHRRASSWRAARFQPAVDYWQVSIPSQAGILLAGGIRLSQRLAVRLNTLTGGHPLGGGCSQAWRWLQSGLNTLTGGHPLGGQE